MASKNKSSLGMLILQIALGCFLLAFGILTLQLDKGILGKLQAGVTGNEVAIAVNQILKGDVANIVIIILGICEIISGAGLLISLFTSLGKIASLFNLIVLIAWIVVIVVIDIMGPVGLLNGAFKNMWTFLFFLKTLALHMLVLGAILTVKS
ncbi:MAG: hypothetical protein IKQ84_07425 [Spirochaetaceae bacterium]|jgi:hypothetical protein|nr:hypothetical protein [Spirochaetaceae bacterium]